jgi:lantibiotic transport system ATP-binding protein
MPSSPDLLIQTTALTRRFGKETAVNALDLHVPAGSVYGFLGPNGAGKTTTIRMLLGLIRPSAGEVRLFGRRLEENRLDLLQRTGALVESPNLYPHLSGRENLEVTRRLRGLPLAAVERALALTGLSAAASKLVRAYSLGMRQRLALALALMPDPVLLLLDEPTNGLDPAGIHEIRELIIALPKEHGITVFLSSHLLGEVEQVASHLGILQRGSLIFEGELGQLQARRQPHLNIGTPRQVEARDLLEGEGWQVLPSSNGVLRVAASSAAEAARANQLLVSAGLPVEHLSLEQPSLEEIFLSLTHEAIQ